MFVLLYFRLSFLFSSLLLFTCLSSPLISISLLSSHFLVSPLLSFPCLSSHFHVSPLLSFPRLSLQIHKQWPASYKWTENNAEVSICAVEFFTPKPEYGEDTYDLKDTFRAVQSTHTEFHYQVCVTVCVAEEEILNCRTRINDILILSWVDKQIGG